jgi:urocanate hydratase
MLVRIEELKKRGLFIIDWLAFLAEDPDIALNIFEKIMNGEIEAVIIVRDWEEAEDIPLPIRNRAIIAKRVSQDHVEIPISL